MLRGTYPGIYTREIPSGVRSIAGVPTAIAAFVGPTRTGIDGRPVRVLNFGDFERSHGGLASDSEMSYGVMHFFQNGGGEALVVRVARAGAAKAKSVANNSTGAMLTIEALSSGASGNDIFVEIEAARSITGQNAVTARTFGLTLAHGGTGVLETFPGISTDAASLTFAKSVVNDPDLGSKLAAIDLTVGAEAPMATGTTIRITADPAFFGTAERKATKQYSIKAGLFAIINPAVKYIS